MINVGTIPSSALDALADAVDRVAEIDVAAFDPDQGPNTLTALITLASRIGGEIARVAAALDESGAWREAGATSMAAYMSNETGLGWGAARASIELGGAMSRCPELDTAIRSGQLSPAAAAKIIPALNDDGFDDVAADLIDEVVGLAPTKVATHIEAWRAVANPVDDSARRMRAEAERSVRFRPAGDGMTEINGIVSNRTAQSLRRALKHLADQQRSDGSDRTNDQRRADALGDLCNAYERGEVTGGRNLPRVIATITLTDLEERSGVATGTFGENISSHEIDQICCDAVMHRSVANQTGAILNFGRGRRTISPQQFMALVARDRGCRHPGCDRPPEWCEGHHINEFAAQGGSTDLGELALLCQHHHHNIHDRSWDLTGTPDRLVFTGPDGRVHLSALPLHDNPQRSAA